MKRPEIIAAARRWLGAPYRHQGRTQSGVDCIGLILAVMEEFGVPAPAAPNNYSKYPSGQLLLRHCDENLVKADKVLVPGSVAILYGVDRLPQHFAIIGEHSNLPTMIHAFSKRKQVVEHSWDLFWTQRLIAVYEIPGTEPYERGQM
jgi:cell wall-associated NlpC family hydrolase